MNLFTFLFGKRIRFRVPSEYRYNIDDEELLEKLSIRGNVREISYNSKLKYLSILVKN